MKIPFRTLFAMVFLVVIIAVAGFLGYRYATVDRHTETSKEILLEKVTNVVKLGTVEGSFSEIYDYSDLEFYNVGPGILQNVFHSRKKALIRVKANVLIGYNLDSIDLDIIYLTQKIIIRDLPEPEILSIDHDLEYYDIENGYFNRFSREDYNMIQKDAKDFIRQKALESTLFNSAEKQLLQNLELLNWAMQEAGWEIVIKEDNKPLILN